MDPGGAEVLSSLPLGSQLPVFLRIRVRILDIAGGTIFLRGGLGRVFRFAPGILNFAFSLLGRPVDLLLGVAGPLADLPFDTARDILEFPFNAIFIHDHCSSLDSLSNVLLKPTSHDFFPLVISFHFVISRMDTKRPQTRLAREAQPLNWAAALNDAHQNSYDRQHQQDVDESAQGVRAHHPKQP
jgi:hypothetical protein